MLIPARRIKPEGPAMPLAASRPTSRRTTRIAAVTGTATMAASLLSAVTAAPALAGNPGCDGRDVPAIFCNPKTVTPGSGGSGNTGGSGGGGGGDEDVPGCGGGQFADCLVPDAQPVAEAPTAAIVQSVLEERALPVPSVNTAPEGKTYVQVKTRLWVGGFTTVSTDPATVGTQTVQITATPKNVRWQLGETEITCEGAGSPNNDSCSYTYNRSSAGQRGGKYQVTATITWGVAWTCTGAACDAPAGTVDDIVVPSAAEPLAVGEIQTNSGQ
ncbi:hypothetical protein [Spirillospora sp. NPDC047279]|uniref:hypothetical protein n=1 Tax=Spirillospora sp. NPDC047279 TaxID=3155478 RepID=UPI00340E2E62